MSEIRFNRWSHQSGTGGIYQDSSGNIGIGTSTPTSVLDIQGGSIKIGNDLLTSSGVSTFTSGLNVTSGSVGIGTDVPLVKLDSKGTVQSTGSSRSSAANWISAVGDGSAYDNMRMWYTGYNSGAPRLYLSPGTVPGSGTVTSYLHLQSNTSIGSNTFGLLVDGKVGIGTDNPVSELMVENATQSHITVKTSGSNMAKFGSKGNDVYIGGTAGAANIIFKRNIVSTDHPADSGTETLRITSSGEVNIGNNLTQTTYLSEISGPYNKAGLRVVSGAPNYEDPFVVATATGGERFRITGDGYVGIGATNPGADPAVGNDANILEIRRTTAGSITSGNTRRGAVLRLKHEVNWENPYSGGDDVGRIEFATGDDSTGEGLRSVIRCEAVNYYNTNDLVFDVADYASATMKERLRISHDGQINMSGLDGTLRNPSMTNIQRNGLILFPSSANGTNDYSGRHMFSIAQSQGSWLNGETGTIHSSWGPLWTYHDGSGNYFKRAGIHYDHHSSEQFKFWSSYGDFVFKTDTGKSGNETAETCDREGMRITYQGYVTKSGMPSFAAGYSVASTTWNVQSSGWTKIVMDTERWDNRGNYDTSTSRFTAPVAGYYLFGCVLQLENPSYSGNAWMYINPVVNGSTGSVAQGASRTDVALIDYYNQYTRTDLLELAAGDYVEYWRTGNLGGGNTIIFKGGTESYWWGYLVG